MKLFLALVLAACLGVTLAYPGMDSSSGIGNAGMSGSMNGQDLSSRLFQDPFTGRMYSNYQVHRALDTMYGSGSNNNQMMYDSQGMNQPSQQQYSSNANRG